jgi:hypothetical protein
MKYVIFCILTLSALGTIAQRKMSYDLLFDVSAVFGTSKPVIENRPGVALYDANTGMITYIPGSSRTSNEYKNIVSPKISLGARLNYTVKQNIEINAGVSVSFLQAKRENTFFFPGLGPNSNFKYITTESIKFYNLDIPLGATYIYNKWSFNLGITPSIILHSKLTQVKKGSGEPQEVTPIFPWTANPQDPQPSPDNKIKSFISLSISPLYQLSNKLKIGLEYNHGLNESYAMEPYPWDVYQSMKTSTLGLKILYKLY